jgi:uncharacterized protein YtpQ (UPF0354 family)
MTDMWPWSKKSAPSFTSRAIAYVKADLTGQSLDDARIKLSADDSPVLKSLGNGLLVDYVVDNQNQFQYVQNRHLRDEGVTEAQLHEIGIANLTNLAATRPLRVQSHQDIFGVFLDGNFEASMLLLDDLWASGFRQFVRGDYLAALPTRDVFAFCDAASPSGRSELVEIVAKLKNSTDHPISHSLYRRVATQWVPQAVN